MAGLLIFKDGTVTGVYDDRFLPLIEAFGPPKITRATEVEFDHSTGEWVATLISTGQEIGRGRNRTELIKQEVEYLERELREGRTPCLT